MRKILDQKTRTITWESDCQKIVVTRKRDSNGYSAIILTVNRASVIFSTTDHRSEYAMLASLAAQMLEDISKENCSI